MPDDSEKSKHKIGDHDLAKKYNELTQKHIKKIPKAAMLFGVKEILTFISDVVRAVVLLDYRVKDLEAQLEATKQGDS